MPFIKETLLCTLILSTTILCLRTVFQLRWPSLIAQVLLEHQMAASSAIQISERSCMTMKLKWPTSHFSWHQLILIFYIASIYPTFYPSIYPPTINARSIGTENLSVLICTISSPHHIVLDTYYTLNKYLLNDWMNEWMSKSEDPLLERIENEPSF